MSSQGWLSALNNKLDHINLEGQLDSLFQEQDYQPKHRKNIEISKHLLRTTTNYLLLRENLPKMAKFSNQDLVIAHQQLQTANRLRNSRQPLNSALNSKYFLYSHAVLAELAYRIITQLGIADLTVEQPKLCFLSVVYVATGKLISPLCYQLILQKLKKKEEFKGKTTKSIRNPMKEGSQQFRSVGSGVDKFRRQLRDNLPLRKHEKNEVHLTKSCKKVKSLAKMRIKTSCKSKLPQYQMRERAQTVLHISCKDKRNNMPKESNLNLDNIDSQKTHQRFLSIHNTATSSPKYSNF